MYEVHAHAHFACSPEQAFAAVSDHEKFLAMPGLSCRLVSEGTQERNGERAVRRVDAGRVVFTETITVFEAPRRLEYLITSLVNKKGRPLPIEHLRGWIEFEAHAGGTRVDWRSRFRVTVPGLGWVVERFAGAGTRNTFQQLLDRCSGRLATTH